MVQLFRSKRSWRPILLLGLLPLLFACAGQRAGNNPAPETVELPEFPPFKPADDFLRMQAWLDANQPPSPPPFVYTERNAEIYRKLDRRIRYSNAEIEFRARRLEEAQRSGRAANLEGWTAYRERLAQAEIESALREENASRESRGRLNRRFEKYQRRLADQRLEQQARERLIELNRREASIKAFEAGKRLTEKAPAEGESAGEPALK